MSKRLSRTRLTFAAALAAALLGASALPLVTASCGGQRPADEPRGFERLRTLTRGGATPPEPAVAAVASEYAGTRAGALALVLQARLRAAANDPARAATLLQSADIKRHTAVADHALWLRAEQLEKLGRAAEARAALEELAREHPDSLRAREATLRAARFLSQAGQHAAVPLALKKLADADDPEALLVTAQAHEQAGDPLRALAAYRRLYFYAPTVAQSDAEAAAAIPRLGSTLAPASAAEAAARADQLFRARRYAEAVGAYADAFGRHPETQTPEAQLRRGVAAFHARRAPETLQALTAVPLSAGDTRAEALHHLAQHHARSRQWAEARAAFEELRRAFPKNPWTMRAVVALAQAAKEMKYGMEAASFQRLAVQLFPGEPEVAGAQFELAWAAHEAKNFGESARLLTEHLALYADRNTDNRGRAGYWAARDSERAGRLGEAERLYEALLERYDANWYGYLARQRLEVMERAGQRRKSATTDSAVLARAAENLKPVVIAEETGGPAGAARLRKAEQLAAVGMDDAAHAELDKALGAAPTSPRLNLAKAQLHRARNDNVQAFNVLRRSFPDYSQMEVEELTAEEWDVFYPLAYWDIIVPEARARSLDPYTVAGLIRQESVFNPRAASHANAYGLMQLLVPTARLTARRYGVDDQITAESLFEPRLNIRLGTGYLRDQMDKFGRLEYVAAAYNAGPGRAAAWRASLPLQLDEWAEAIPFRETRGYVQGVVRNMLQYRRLYDERGRFRPEVGSRAARPPLEATPPAAPADANQRPRRVSSNEEE
ncbi:MAG TPA: transglycosylase SLT domain-containing protein [Pyrinomonadaceae bacterium]|nr:transglycosylase SLT domain-containing protein [Pyrinomonadaceae bacterium]